jgi:colanic acid/amylovoran biosynthesis glycosyltransferase
MKIVHIVNTFPAFSQTFILNQIGGLTDSGYKIDIIAHRKDVVEELQPDVKRLRLLERTRYIGSLKSIMPRNMFKRYIYALAILFSNIVHNKRPLVRSLNLRKYGKNALSLNYFFKAYQFIRLQMDEYDVVHAHFGPNGNLAALLKDLGVIRGLVITTFYGYDVSKYVERSGRGVYKKLFEMGDLILVLSNEMNRELIELGCPEEKIRIHHLGIDVDKFTYTGKNRSLDGTLQVVTVGRLVEKKGVEFAIEAISTLIKENLDVRFTIVGDGPLRSDMEKTIASLGAGNHIRILGWKDQNEIVDLLSGSDIFLAPSVTAMDGDREGTPTVLMEAQALGLPVVSTYHSGIPEVVEDGVTGYLVKERDSVLLEEAIKKMISDPGRLTKMGRAGRKKVLDEFNIRTLNQTLLDYYKLGLDGR